MKMEVHHHVRDRNISLGYEALLLKLPEELRDIAMQYIMNFTDAMVTSPLHVAAHWLHMISLTLFSRHLRHSDQKTLHEIYNLAMKDLTEAERAEHEKRHHAAHSTKSYNQAGKVKKGVQFLLEVDGEKIR